MKKYRIKTEAEEQIEILQAAGCKVTATNWEIQHIDVPDNVDIKTLEQQTGLKFKEKEG